MWVSDLCLGGVGWWFALLVVSPVVGMVKFLRRHSPVCFLGVVALASAAAAAVRLCPVYLGVAHFTKVENAQTAAELAVFLGRLLLLRWHLLSDAAFGDHTGERILQNLILTLQNNVSPNGTPHNQTFV